MGWQLLHILGGVVTSSTPMIYAPDQAAIPSYQFTIVSLHVFSVAVG